MFQLVPRPYDHPDVARLVAELQAEYVQIYGTPDETHIEQGEFDPPNGLFVLGLLDGDPVVSGAWRRVDGSVATAEIKRMYVAQRARSMGLSRLMLTELESRIAAAGYERVLLMTGARQTTAIALYESSGYLPADAYGLYADEPDARFYSKLVGVSAVASSSRAMRG